MRAQHIRAHLYEEANWARFRVHRSVDAWSVTIRRTVCARPYALDATIATYVVYVYDIWHSATQSKTYTADLYQHNIKKEQIFFF